MSMYLEDVFEEELGAAPKKKKKAKVSVSMRVGVKAPKKKKKKLGAKIKRGLKAVASGGMSEAARAAKKTKIGRKIIKGAKAVMTGGASLAFQAAKKAAKKKIAKTKTGKLIGGLVKKPALKKSAAVVANVKAKKIGSCSCKDDMAKLVAAKLIAELGPPLNEATRALKKLELQRAATYEHKKLMTDSDFRRKVLEFIAKKAGDGNKSAKRTIQCLRG